MSAQKSRAVIDSLAFARDQLELRGTLTVGELDRLQDSLFDDGGRVDYEIRGGQDARGRPLLLLKVRGRLHLRCQRCLESLEYAVTLDNALLLQAAADSCADDGDDADCITPDPQLDVAALVEDELILGLPYAPMHAEGRCRAQARAAVPAGTRTALAELANFRRDRN